MTNLLLGDTFHCFKVWTDGSMKYLMCNSTKRVAVYSVGHVGQDDFKPTETLWNMSLHAGWLTDKTKAGADLTEAKCTSRLSESNKMRLHIRLHRVKWYVCVQPWCVEKLCVEVNKYGTLWSCHITEVSDRDTIQPVTTHCAITMTYHHCCLKAPHSQEWNRQKDNLKASCLRQPLCVAQRFTTAAPEIWTSNLSMLDFSHILIICSAMVEAELYLTGLWDD